MSDKSKIEWTDASWTPIRARNRATGKVGWHCEHVTPGCEHCYAEAMNLRLGTGLPFKPGHRKDIEIFLDEAMLTQPLRWKRPRMIFVCSMTDLFASFVPDELIDRIFAVMALCPQHTFQVLTKRPERMRAYLSDPMMPHRVNDDMERVAPAHWHRREWQDYARRDDVLPNVWLGTSVEDQQRADERVPELLATPATVRFISAEPLLGPVRLAQWLHDSDCRSIDVLVPSNPHDDTGLAANDAGPCTCSEPREDHIDWVIAGGESGKGARPMHPDWARALRDQCAAAGVAFFFKQWGEHLPVGSVDRGSATDPSEFGWERVGKKAAGRRLDGVEHNAMPEARR